MSVLADYIRFRFLWGAVDWQSGSGSPYSTAQTGASLGTSAAAGSGVGVRRVVLRFNRLVPSGFTDDQVEMHFDFLNLTGGDPDDTWTSTDYSTLEGYLDTFWTTMKAQTSSQMTLVEYRWYRYGPGINPPNPAERVTTRSVAGTGASTDLPPQCAATVTFKTAVRKSWGRTYLPGLIASKLTSTNGLLSSAFCDTYAGAVNTLFTSANGSDFHPVVVSKHLNAALSIEQVVVDDVVDIQRRRRWGQAEYRKTLP